jgi:transcriptional regulator with PAS, ATPase and Fis domain
MNQNTLLMIFIGVSSLAIVIQAAMLVAMYATTKKTSAQFEKLAEEVRTKALPTAESVRMLIVDNKGKIEDIVDNLSVATSTARSQLTRLDATFNDVLDRTRLQVMRADELATSTMDRIEETTEIVQHTIVSPVRRINGVLSALSTGVGMFVAGRRAQKATPKAGAGQQEDMFI